MTSQAIDDLLAVMLADPDDEAARLVYADAIGGERGEAIALAAELGRAGLTSLEDLVQSPIEGAELVHRAEQHRRFRQIVGRHVPAWVAELDCNLRLGPRGMLDRATVFSAADLPKLARAATRTPIVELDLSATEAGWVDALAQVALPGLAYVEMTGAIGDTEIDAFERVLAGTPRLTSVKLVVADAATPRTIERIVDALARLPRLVRLRLQNASDHAIDRLGNSALAARLRELDVYATRTRPDPRRFVDPLAIFDGRFAGLDALGLWLDRDVEPGRAPSRLVVPTRLGLYGGLGQVGFAAILPALADIRELTFYQPSDWRLPIAALARAAPRVTRLATDVDPSRLNELAGLPLRHLKLFPGRDAPTGAVAAFVTGFELASFELHGYRPGLGDLAPALAAAPRLHGLRELSIYALDVDDVGAEAIARSPYLAHLRQIMLSGPGPLSRRGIAALTTLPDLVDLWIDGSWRTRPVAAMLTHPVLARVNAGMWASRAMRAAIEERFGAVGSKTTAIYVFVPHPLGVGDLARSLPDNTSDLRFRGDTIRIGLDDASIEVRADPQDELAAAAGDLGTPFVSKGQIAITPIAPNLPRAALVPIVRGIASSLSAVAIWDSRDDVLLDPANPLVAP